ncbi:MAG: hypothetical protein HKN14_08105 [Marinicaulis sp.]|nr:hypothetical protein [Marinicaulis sp.]NNE40867.1 hypothetical protein [Marinicaulis sp.]NNL87803.1 hypothetical protein [Marinicaulis sp.]
MGMLTRLLGALPKNMLVPAVVLMAGWYGGAKYGAPEMLMNSVDGAIAEAGDLIGGFMGGEEDGPSNETIEG